MQSYQSSYQEQRVINQQPSAKLGNETWQFIEIDYKGYSVTTDIMVSNLGHVRQGNTNLTPVLRDGKTQVRVSYKDTTLWVVLEQLLEG